MCELLQGAHYICLKKKAEVQGTAIGLCRASGQRWVVQESRNNIRYLYISNILLLYFSLSFFCFSISQLKTQWLSLNWELRAGLLRFSYELQFLHQSENRGVGISQWGSAILHCMRQNSQSLLGHRPLSPFSMFLEGSSQISRVPSGAGSQ